MFKLLYTVLRCDCLLYITWRLDLYFTYNSPTSLILIVVDSKGLAPVAQEFLKKGCPTALRGTIYQHILGSHIAKEVKTSEFFIPVIIPHFLNMTTLLQHLQYYHELRQAVIKSDLLIDRLTLKVNQPHIHSTIWQNWSKFSNALV